MEWRSGRRGCKTCPSGILIGSIVLHSSPVCPTHAVTICATAAEKLERTSRGVDADPLPFPHPFLSHPVPLLLHPRFTHSLPYSSFLLPLYLARKFGEALQASHCSVQWKMAASCKSYSGPNTSGAGARFTKYLATILRLSYDNAICCRN